MYVFWIACLVAFVNMSRIECLLVFVECLECLVAFFVSVWLCLQTCLELSVQLYL